MMKGLPASGKSTTAKQLIEDNGNWVRVNRDLLRTMLHFDKWTGPNEKKTVQAEKALVREFLKQGNNVIVDDTNMGQSHLDMWREIAKECEAELSVLEKGTSFEECIAREKERNKVGTHVLYRMGFENQLVPKPEKPFVLCDIDGTIADCEHRRHYVQQDPKDWKSFFAEMDKDMPRLNVLQTVQDYKDRGHEVILLTARPDDYREVTEKWVKTHTNINPMTIIMRHSGDTRPDVEVKQQMFDKYFKDKYEIATMIDDRPSVIRMWKENNVPVIDVGDGIEF